MSTNSSKSTSTHHVLRAISHLYSRLQRSSALVCCGDEMTYTQCQIVTTMGRGQQVTVQSLANTLDVDKAWVSRVVGQLESEALVRKERDAGDRRRQLLLLTHDGERHCNNLNNALDEHADEILRRIPADKRANVAEALQLVHHVLEECVAETVTAASATQTTP